MPKTKVTEEEALRAAREESQELLGPVTDAPAGMHDGLGLGLTGGAVTRSEDAGMSMTPAFSRMRTDFAGPDYEIVQQQKAAAEGVIMRQFGEIVDILADIYLLVRKPKIKPGTVDEVVTDAFGNPEWQLNPGTNTYVEDWSQFTYREREMFIFKITTGLFAWTNRRDDFWLEAMFARAQFEEAYAVGYAALKEGTVDDHVAHGRKLSAEYRYYAVYASYLSRRADSCVRTIELLGQRLKDLSTS